MWRFYRFPAWIWGCRSSVWATWRWSRRLWAFCYSVQLQRPDQGACRSSLCGQLRDLLLDELHLSKWMLLISTHMEHFRRRWAQDKTAWWIWRQSKIVSSKLISLLKNISVHCTYFTPIWSIIWSIDDFCVPNTDIYYGPIISDVTWAM